MYGIYIYIHMITHAYKRERESPIHCTLFSHISVPPVPPPYLNPQSHDFIVLQDHQILGLRDGNLKAWVFHSFPGRETQKKNTGKKKIPGLRGGSILLNSSTEMGWIGLGRFRVQIYTPACGN